MNCFVFLRFSGPAAALIKVHEDLARCFLGGPEDAGVLQESDEAILGAVTGELQETAGFRAQPRFTRVFRWPSSMAQHNVGHPERVAEIDARTAAIQSLHLSGNAYRGIGIPDCIRMGKPAAAADTNRSRESLTSGSSPDSN